MSARTLVEKTRDEVDHLANSNVDTKDSDVRYIAYAARIRTALRASARYFAYVSINLLGPTSDIGEAFRPVINPRWVTAAYGVSWIYVIGDVSYETYKAHRKGPTSTDATIEEPTRLSLVALQRGTFQAVASMGLPALTIHTIVAQSTKLYRKTVKNARVRAWGPTLTGLAVVPFLPYVFDEPVENLTDRVFGWIKKRYSEGRAPDSMREHGEV